MKKIVFVFILAIGLTTIAQEKITEGKITFKQTMSSDNEQMKAQIAMMGEMNIVTMFKGQKSRTEVSSPATGSNITIVDGVSKKGVTLMDNPYMGKVYTTMDIEPTEEDLKNVKVVKTGKTKSILGYDCNEYEVIMKQPQGDVNMSIYSTEVLNIASDRTAGFGKDFRGFPLYFSITMNQPQMGTMNIIMEATEINKEEVSDGLFSLTPPEGYKLNAPPNVD